MLYYLTHVRRFFLLTAFFVIGVTARAEGYALLVGANKVDKYKTKYAAGSVAGAKQDALSIQQLLVKSGFKQNNITVLADEKATASAILGYLRSIVKNLDSGDLFVLYFSGHGDTVTDLNHDEGEFMNDQVLVTYTDYIIDDTLYHFFRRINKNAKSIFLVDACYSGEVYKMMTEKIKKVGFDKMKPQANQFQCSIKYDKQPFNMYYMGACSKAKTTIPMSDGTGRFTFNLVGLYYYLELQQMLKSTKAIDFFMSLCNPSESNNLVIIAPGEDRFTKDFPFQL